MAVLFPNDIATYRKRAGITQRALSIQLGFIRSRLSLWETGRSVPTFDEAHALIGALGVTLMELYPRSEIRDLIISTNGGEGKSDA